MSHIRSFAFLLTLVLPSAALGQLQVVSHSPTLNAFAAPTVSVSVTFNQAVNTSTIDLDTFRVAGQWSGRAEGTYSFSNGNMTVTLTPDDPFSAGEFVFVNLSHDIMSASAQPLRAEGYAFQFMTTTAAAPATFSEIDTFSNVTGGQTRIYGANAADLNNDNYLDLATINEVSADVRVFLNLADGSGLYGPMLSPEPIGTEASPNAPADFNNDGNMDLVVGAAVTDDVWILLGAGDGTFASATGINTGDDVHGVIPIDVDGDADLDVVSANVGSNNLALLINDGAGNFAAPVTFSGTVNGEYSLAAADMDGDGITDLVVAGRNSGELVTLLGNGDGTFTAAAAPQSTGGNTWVVVIGDINADGFLDAATANDGSGNVGILTGNGDGTFDAVTTINIGSHVPSVDLGDLDGDGDLDLVVSSFGGGFWRWYQNDGSGSFSAVDSFPAPANPSCAVLLDFDNDGDLDLALTDEIADVVVLMENGGTSSCEAAPRDCRFPIAAGKSTLVLRDKSPDDRDSLTWNWRKGETTTKAELGNPLGMTDGYALCLYEDGVLVQGFEIPPGQMCGDKPCWKEGNKGYSYRDRDRTPDGISAARMVQGLEEGKAAVGVRGKGTRLGLPSVSDLDGVLEVQLQRVNDPLCFGAVYTPPFKKHDDETLRALSDAPPVDTVPDPIWSEIHALVIGPTCGSCHGGGGSGGLGGLNDCNMGHASLVGVASTELPTMSRVAAGDPTMSWLMHKLDGTQGMFTTMCGGMFCGSQMPLGGDPLSTEVRDAIRTWIMTGATNDCP
jgi:hypothetical protein